MAGERYRPDVNLHQDITLHYSQQEQVHLVQSASRLGRTFRGTPSRDRDLPNLGTGLNQNDLCTNGQLHLAGYGSPIVELRGLGSE